MSESADHSRAAPRFPYVAAVLCAACVGAAVWTWMRYSYAWEATAQELWHTGEEEMRRVAPRDFTEMTQEEWMSLGQRRYSSLALRGAYVRLQCTATSEHEEYEWGDEKTRRMWILSSFGSNTYLVLNADAALPKAGDRVVVLGRALLYQWEPGAWWLEVDTTASRFTGASIAGLVVGAMGVFVFAAALRHWLGERRRNEIAT